MDIIHFVDANLYTFLYSIMTSIGLSVDAVNTVFNFIAPILAGPFGDLGHALLFPPIALWYFVDTGIGDVYTWIVTRLNTVWDRIYAIINSVTPVINVISDVIANGINDLFAWINTGFTNFYNWVGAEITSVNQWVTKAFSDVYNWVYGVVSDVDNWVAGLINGVYNYFNTAFVNSYNWVSQQIGTVTTWAIAQLTGLSTWFYNTVGTINSELAPLNDFMNWWRGGAGNLLTQFAHNPSQLIFDLLYAQFLRWLTQVIIDNW